MYEASCPYTRVNDCWITSVRMSIHCGKDCWKLQKHAKSWKIASAKICAHVKRVLKPYHALRFTDFTMFARTDITSSLMRFVERGHKETCFSFNCVYINRTIYMLDTFLLAMYAFRGILYTFFQPFSLRTYNFHRWFWETNFLWIVLRATFNSTFGYIELQTPMFCLIQLMQILNAFLLHIFPLFDNNLIEGKVFFWHSVLLGMSKKPSFGVNYPRLQFLTLCDSLEVSVSIVSYLFDWLCLRNHHTKFH